MLLRETNYLKQAVEVALPLLTKDNISYMASTVGMRGAERDTFLANPHDNAKLWALHFGGVDRIRRVGLRVLFSLLDAFGVGMLIEVIRAEVYGAESLEALSMPPASRITLNATDPVRSQMMNVFGLLAMVRLPSDAEVLPLARHIGMPEADAADRPKIFERLMSMPTLPDEILALLALARSRVEPKPAAPPARGPTRITAVQLNVAVVRAFRAATCAERGMVADVLGVADRRHRLAAPGASDAEMIEAWTECFSDLDGAPNSYRTPAHGLAVLFDVIRALVIEEMPNEPNIKAILQKIRAPAELCLPPAGLIYRARCCALAIIVRLDEDERSTFADMHFITLRRPVGAADLFGRFARYMAGIGWRDALERAARAGERSACIARAERSACGIAEYVRAARELIAEPDAPPPAAPPAEPPASAVCTSCRDSCMQPDSVELVQTAQASSSPAAAAAVCALARIDEARAAKNDTGADELDCPLCMDYKKNVALSCGHTVCVRCFNQSYGGKEAPPCATCRGPVTSYLILYN